MKTLLTSLLLVFCLNAISQDYIKSDFNLGITTISNAEVLFSPGGKTMISSWFDLFPLKKDFLPADNDTILQPSDDYPQYLGSSLYNNNALMLAWTSVKYDPATVYHVKAQIFDSLYNAVTDEIVVDSNTSSTGYSYEAYLSKSADKDNDIGIAWASGETLYARFINTTTKQLSARQEILKGTGVSGIQAVDFMHNGNIRIIWRDVNSNLRHKKISKTGEVLNNESILFGPGDGAYYSGITRYTSNINGDFMLAELHQHPETYNYGIDVRKYNADATLTNGPVWICDSVTFSAYDDLREIFQISMQDDGKAAVVWRDMLYDQALSNYVDLLFMQFLDHTGNLYGQTFRPVNINNESYSKSYAIYEQYPFIRLKNDTIILAWQNYNTEFSNNAYLYMNIQKYTLQEVSPIKDHVSNGISHWFIHDDVSGECFIMINSPANTNVRLELYDALGRTVAASGHHYLQSGINKIPLDRLTGLNYNKGLYIYRFLINGMTYTGKICR
ncbi:MAG: T9SS type A sorting domain-containing protein [Bacteroidales bacterium]|nr:T9SS type A sorting domain-containing protein [Bacteroidales bacterium]